MGMDAGSGSECWSMRRSHLGRERYLVYNNMGGSRNKPVVVYFAADVWSLACKN